MLCSMLRLSCRKIGAQSEIGLSFSPKWLNSAPKCIQVIIEEGGVLWPITLPYAYFMGLYPISDNFVRE